MNSELSRSTMRDLRDMRSLQAEQTSKILELRDEVRKVSGKVDELEYIVRGKTKKLQEELQKVTSRVPPPEGVSEALLEDDEAKISKHKGSSVEQYKRGLGEIRAGNFRSAYLTFSNFIDKNPDTAFTDNALFWTAICFEKMNQIDRAIVAYSDIYQRFPKEDRVPDALFKLSESLAKLGSKEDAILSYQKLIADFPKHPLASKARKRIRNLK